MTAQYKAPPRSFVTTLSYDNARTLDRLAKASGTRPEAIIAKLVEAGLASALVTDEAVELSKPKRKPKGRLTKLVGAPRDATRAFPKRMEGGQR